MGTFNTECTVQNKTSGTYSNILIKRTNFRQPTVHVQQNIFDITVLEVCSTHLNVSFGTFCFQIGQ